MDDNNTVKSKSKSTYILLGIVIALAILVLVLVIILTTTLFKTPKQRVMLALTKTFGNNSLIAELSGNEKNNDSSFSDDYILSLSSIRDIRNSIADGKFETSWSYKLEDGCIDGEDIGLAKGAAIAGSAYSDIENRLFYGDYRIKYCGFKLLGFKLFANDNEIAFADKDFFDGYIMVDTETIGKDFVNSDLAKLAFDGVEFSENIEDLSFNIFELSDSSNSMLLNPLYDNADKLIAPLYTLYDSIEVKKSGNKEDYTIDGNIVHTTGYTITITADAMSQFVSDFQPYMESFLENYIEKMEDISQGEDISDIVTFTFDGKVYSIDELDDYSEDVCDALADVIDDMDDFEIEVFIDNKCRLIAANYEASFEDPDIDEEITIEANINFTGSSFLTDTIDASIVAQSDRYDEDLVITFTKDTDVDDNIRTSEAVLSIEVNNIYDDEEFEFGFSYDTTYDTDNGDYYVEVEFSSDDSDDVFKIYSEGNIIYDDASLSIEFESIGIDADINGEEMMLELSGDYYISALEDDIPEPTGTKREILKMSSSELMEFAEDINDNLKSSTFGSLFSLIF